MRERHLDKRLSFLLEDGDREVAQSFRDEYKRRFLALQNEERELEGRRRHLQLLQKQLSEVQDTKGNWVEHVNQAISCIGKKDFTSLKSIYRQLFQKIVVRPMGWQKCSCNSSLTTYL